MKDYSYWWDTVGGPPKPSEKAESLDGVVVDVAVIGGGYTGLAAARQLARAGASVAVLERHWAGWGASSRNAGQVLTGLRLEPAALVARFGEGRARELFGASIEAIGVLEAVIAEEQIACEYDRSGHIEAAWKSKHFDGFRAKQELLDRVFHHKVSLVPRENQPSELASGRYCGLLVDDRSAAINPAKYARGLHAAARRAGAVVHDGVEVHRIDGMLSRWRLVTSAGTCGAGEVLVATNAYTGSASPELQRRLIPLGSYLIATEPLGAANANRLLPKHRTAFDSKHFLYYFRVTSDERLLFGGRAEFGTPSSDRTRQAATILRRGLTDVFPQLTGVRIDYGWSGKVAFTRDQLPRAGRLGGLWFAGGYGGHGIAMATYLGNLVARRMAGELIEHPLFDDRLAAIPLYTGRPWFLPLMGAYYRIKDLIE